MSILKILQYPDKKLRIKTKPIKIFNQKLKNQISNMFETMYYNNGIGLAAIQVNIKKSIIVINITKKIILINPKIINRKGSIRIEEKCLSIPNYKLKIKRSNILKISNFNIKGEKYFIYTKGILSICIQHEIDHLKGKLLIDYDIKYKKKN